MAKSSLPASVDVPEMPNENGNDSVVQGLQKMGYQQELTRVRSIPLLPRPGFILTRVFKTVSRPISYLIQCVFKSIALVLSSQAPSLVTLGTPQFSIDDHQNSTDFLSRDNASHHGCS